MRPTATSRVLSVDGAVRVFRADPRQFVLLVERLHEDDLVERWDEGADADQEYLTRCVTTAKAVQD